MTRHISDKLLSQLCELISCRLGLHFPDMRLRDLERRMKNAALELGFGNAEQYIQRLLSCQVSREELEILATHLTIGETYFFREKGGFDILQSRILPELIESRRGKERRLRLWSAGCSTGEEPYSLAIILRRLIPDIDEWNVTILATDINRKSLARAAAGIYREWSFRGVPEWIRRRFFNHREDGSLEVLPHIRKMVTFSNLNLVEDTYPSLANNTNAMDIILCRNVLMYFGRDQARRVAAKLHHSLLDGGWLLVSPCEASSEIFPQFESVTFPAAVFYRKQGRRTGPDYPLPTTPEGVGSVFPQLQAEILHPPPSSPLIPPAAEGVSPSPRPEPSPHEEALELHRRGEDEKALEKLYGFLRDSSESGLQSSSHAKAAAMLAEILADGGHLAEALRWSEEAMVVDKLDPHLHYLHATILQELGRNDEAMESLKRSLYLDQGFVLAHFAMGNLTLKHGDRRESERHFDNALELLRSCRQDDPVPGGDGMTIGRLAEIIESVRMTERNP